MGVHKLKDGRWICQYRIEGKLKREYFGRGLAAEADAKDRFAQVGRRVYRQDRKTSEGPTFHEVLQSYLIDKQMSLAPGSLKSLMVRAKANYIPELGDLSASQINRHIIRMYIDKRSKTVKNNSINRELSDISAILNWAVAQKIILRNAMLGVTWPRDDGEVIRPPDPSEIKAMLNNSPPHLRRTIILAWYFGLRVGEEIFARQWHNISWDSQIFHVISAEKGGIPSRSIPIHSEIYPLLLQWYIEDEQSIINANKDMGKNEIKAKLDESHIIQFRGKRIHRIDSVWARAKKAAGISRRLRLRRR